LLEVADIFRRHGAVYRQKFAQRLLPRHLRAMAAIESCRTASLGGQVFRCDHCDQKLYAYHSCKNRHCPKCHGEQTRRWLDAQRARLLLNCSFYHLTFTLPSEMRPLARAHSKVIYRLLMQAAAAAILKLARDPRYLGAATPGLLAVLHTWTRAMLYHPHVHLLVTAGGISDDGAAWIHCPHRRFFLPERPLSEIFRGKFRHRLKKAGLHALVPKAAWSKPWIVDCKHAGRSEKVLDYLGRYLFRVAITNSRLDHLAQDGTIRFHYRDNRTGDLMTATLSAEQFIGRFLAHVLPKRFTKLRYSGLFSSSNRHRLETSRQLLSSADADSSSQTPKYASLNGTSAQSELVTAADTQGVVRCPHCKVGRLVLIEVIPRPRLIRTKPP
jgi:hypothetical protein